MDAITQSPLQNTLPKTNIIRRYTPMNADIKSFVLRGKQEGWDRPETNYVLPDLVVLALIGVYLRASADN